MRSVADGFAFDLFGFPVTVRWFFFLTLGLLAMSTRSPALIAVWLAAAFVAVLVHELGHALAARLFGLQARIELYAMGGLTYPTGRELRPAEGLVLSLAGPGLGFAFGAVVFVIAGLHGPVHPLVEALERDLLWASIGWGVFNLLPILPMDGGQAMARVMEMAMGPRRGLQVALVISVAASGVGLVLALLFRMPWAGLLCAFFGFSSIQQLRALSRPPAPEPPLP